MKISDATGNDMAVSIDEESDITGKPLTKDDPEESEDQKALHREFCERLEVPADSSEEPDKTTPEEENDWPPSQMPNFSWMFPSITEDSPSSEVGKAVTRRIEADEAERETRAFVLPAADFDASAELRKGVGEEETWEEAQASREHALFRTNLEQMPHGDGIMDHVDEDELSAKEKNTEDAFDGARIGRKEQPEPFNPPIWPQVPTEDVPPLWAVGSPEAEKTEEPPMRDEMPRVGVSPNAAELSPNATELSTNQWEKRVPLFSKGGQGGILDQLGTLKNPPHPPLEKGGDEMASDAVLLSSAALGVSPTQGETEEPARIGVSPAHDEAKEPGAEGAVWLDMSSEAEEEHIIPEDDRIRLPDWKLQEDATGTVTVPFPDRTSNGVIVPEEPKAEAVPIFDEGVEAGKPEAQGAALADVMPKEGDHEEAMRQSASLGSVWTEPPVESNVEEPAEPVQPFVPPESDVEAPGTSMPRPEPSSPHIEPEVPPKEAPPLWTVGISNPKVEDLEEPPRRNEMPRMGVSPARDEAKEPGAEGPVWLDVGSGAEEEHIIPEDGHIRLPDWKLQEDATGLVTAPFPDTTSNGVIVPEEPKAEPIPIFDEGLESGKPEAQGAALADVLPKEGDHEEPVQQSAPLGSVWTEPPVESTVEEPAEPVQPFVPPESDVEALDPSILRPEPSRLPVEPEVQPEEAPPLWAVGISNPKVEDLEEPQRPDEMPRMGVSPTPDEAKEPEAEGAVWLDVSFGAEEEHIIPEDGRIRLPDWKLQEDATGPVVVPFPDRTSNGVFVPEEPKAEAIPLFDEGLESGKPEAQGAALADVLPSEGDHEEPVRQNAPLGSVWTEPPVGSTVEKPAEPVQPFVSPESDVEAPGPFIPQPPISTIPPKAAEGIPDSPPEVFDTGEVDMLKDETQTRSQDEPPMESLSDELARMRFSSHLSADQVQLSADQIQASPTQDVPRSHEMPEVVREVVSQILVTDPKYSSKEEVRIVLQDSFLEGTEIRVSREDGGVKITIVTDSNDSYEFLAQQQEPMSNELQERLDSNVQVSVELTQARQEQNEGRSRQRRSVLDEWEA